MGIFDGRAVAANLGDLGCLLGYCPDSSGLRLWSRCFSCSRDHRVHCVMTCVPNLAGAAGGKLQVSRVPGVRAGSVYLGEGEL